MRRRRRVVSRAWPPGAPVSSDGTAVVLVFVVVAAVAVQPDTRSTTAKDSAMNNMSVVLERLLDNYDMRLRPQFGGAN